MKEDLRDEFYRLLNRYPDASPEDLREFGKGLKKAAKRREKEGDLL